MVLFVLILVAYFVLLGVYVGQNRVGVPISMFVWSWTDVWAWVPAVVAGLAMFALMVLWGGYGRTRHSLRRWSLGRRISAHESEIADLRAENERLRRQNASLQAERERAPEVATDV